jgi:hypothetical protein
MYIFRIATLLLGALLITVAFAETTMDSKNSLVGVITETSSTSRVTPAGSQVTITSVTTDHPTVVWPDGIDAKMTKIFDNENLLVLQMISPTAGSTDTIYVEKKNKRFTVVSVGAFDIVIKKNSVGVSTIRGVIK